MFAQQVLNGVVVGSVYALFSLGLTLVFGVLRVLNLAHGAVFMAGAFLGLIASLKLGWPLPVAALAAMLGAALLSLVVDTVAFAPLRKRRAPEFSAIVASIGVGLVITSIAQQLSGTSVMRYPFDAFPAQAFDVGGLRITLLQLTLILAAAVALGIVSWLVFRTSFGRQLRAVAVNERTALLLGVNATGVHRLTFLLAGALAGLSGVLVGLAFNSVHYLMGEPFMLRAFVVVVLGGLGSVAGAIVGALVLGLLQTLTVAFISTQLVDTVVFSLLFVLLLVRPQGLFGSVQRDQRLERR